MDPTLQSLIDSGMLSQDQINRILMSTNQGAALASGGNANENQAQAGEQTGAYNTNSTGTGTTAQDTSQLNNQLTQGQTSTSGQQQSSTANSGTSANLGTQSTTGQSATNVIDNYGLGGLANNLTSTAGGIDTSRDATLTKLMQTGNPGLQAQTSQAVGQALSGPGMQGTGNMAQGRAAGAAASNVAQNSAGTQLSAAQQLAGPTASGTAIQQASPLLGSATTNSGTGVTANTGSQTGVGTSSGTSSQLGTSLQSLQDMLSGASTGATTSGSNTSGTALGSSVSAGAGQVPQTSTTSGGSGSVVCSHYVDVGWMPRTTVQRSVRSRRAAMRHQLSLAGYMAYGHLILWMVKNSSAFEKWFFPKCRALIYEEIRVANPKVKFKLLPWLYSSMFTAMFYPAGLAVLLQGKDNMIHHKATVAMLNRNDLNFGRWS